jgi:competence protein ComEA
MILARTGKLLRWSTAVVVLLLAGSVLDPLAYAQPKSASTNTPVGAGHPQGLVNINTADAKALETLPGVGPATAQRIIEGRPYHKLSDLQQVKGLTEAKIEALKGKVSFGAPQTAMDKTTGAAKTTHEGSGSASRSKQSAQGSSGTAPAPTTAGGGASSSNHSSANKLAPGEKININTASVEELDRLPGIGRTKAQAIVEYRSQNGSFKRLEDLEKVKGIKAGSFGKLKDHVKLSD